VAIEAANARMPAAIAKFLINMIPLDSKFWGRSWAKRMNLAVLAGAETAPAQIVNSASVHKTQQTRYSLQQILFKIENSPCLMGQIVDH
jgi:hypothetical protein